MTPSDERAEPSAVTVAQVRGVVEPVLFVAVGLGAGEGEYRLGDGLPVVDLVVGAGGEVLLVEPGAQLGVGGLAVALGVGGSQGLRPLTVGALEQAMRPRKSGGRDGADTGDAVQVEHAGRGC